MQMHFLSNENIQNKVKKWLRDQDAFFYLKIETDLVIMGQKKAIMRLSESCEFTLYVAISFK
jgi:hypothetical protein